MAKKRKGSVDAEDNVKTGAVHNDIYDEVGIALRDIHRHNGKVNMTPTQARVKSVVQKEVQQKYVDEVKAKEPKPISPTAASDYDVVYETGDIKIHSKEKRREIEELVRLDEKECSKPKSVKEHEGEVSKARKETVAEKRRQRVEEAEEHFSSGYPVTGGSADYDYER